MQTMLNTTNWVKYPFEVNGVKFNSLIDPQGEFYPKVENLPTGVFTGFNVDAIKKFVGDPSKLSVNQINTLLDVANEGATQALIVLA